MQHDMEGEKGRVQKMDESMGKNRTRPAGKKKVRSSRPGRQFNKRRGTYEFGKFCARGIAETIRNSEFLCLEKL